MLKFLKKLFGTPSSEQDIKQPIHSIDLEPDPIPHTPPPEPQEISTSELQERLKHPESLSLLDVREQHELDSQGWVPGSIHIPMNDVPHRISEIDRAKDVMVICFSGMRSFGVGSYLLDNGFEKVYNVAGGFSAWGGEVERR